MEKEEERISPPSSPEHSKRELGLLTSDFGVDFHQAENRDVFVPSSEVAPLKMPATLTPPDSAHNSPSPSPPMKRKPLPPPSSLPQSQDHGLLSPSSSPSTSMLITGPSSPSRSPVAETKDAKNKDGDVSPSESLLDQSYSELLDRFCFHQSSRDGTPYSSSSAPMLGVLGMSNSYLANSPKTSRGGSPEGSGNNSPTTTSKNGVPRGGSFVLGTPGTAGTAYTKWNAPSGLAGL
jgi:hypothetical protein